MSAATSVPSGPSSKVTNIVLWVSLGVMVLLFLLLWALNPKFLQKSSPVSGTSAAELKLIATQLDAYNKANDKDLKVCSQCSMDGLSFFGMVLGIPAGILVVYGIIAAVQAGKHKAALQGMSSVASRFSV